MIKWTTKQKWIVCYKWPWNDPRHGDWGNAQKGLIGWGVCRPSQAPQIQPGKSDRNHQLHSWSHVFPLEGLIPDAKQSHQLSISHAWPTAPAKKISFTQLPSHQPAPNPSHHLAPALNNGPGPMWISHGGSNCWWGNGDLESNGVPFRWFPEDGPPNHQFFVGDFSILNHPFLGIAPCPQMALECLGYCGVPRIGFFPKANPPT